MVLEVDAAGAMDGKKNKRVRHERGGKRHWPGPEKTQAEALLLRACSSGGRAGEGADVRNGRGRMISGTSQEKMGG